MKWLENEIEYLKKEYPTQKSLREMYNKLGRSRRSVLHKAARLGLSRPNIPANKPEDPEYRKKVDRKYYLNNKGRIYKRKQARSKMLKELTVKLAGGKCSKCGYNSCLAALEFHHKNNDKEDDVRSLIKNSSKQNVLKEANKCILVCANCHRELHSKGT